ncbi:MAG TPA: helix-turn-helix domain-containing protein [Candidatus Paceibacterota bacterium]
MKSDGILKNLGLSSKETLIFLALLELKSATISVLGRYAKLPRTSLYPLLQKLQDKGFVYQGKVKNHTEWKCITPRELYQKYKESLKNLELALPELEDVYREQPLVPKISPLTYYESLEGVKKVYEDILLLPKHERIYSIEGSGSIAAKTTRLNKDYTTNWQIQFKKTGLVWEAVTSETSLRLIEAMESSVLKSHLGRPVIATVLPKELLNFDLDIIAFQNTAAIVNVAKTRVVIVRDLEIVRAIKEFISILSRLGKKIDLNAFMAEIIRRKENK